MDVSVKNTRILRKRIGIGLGVVGVIMLIVGLVGGYIDVALLGLFVAFMGQAILLQERKRPG